MKLPKKAQIAMDWMPFLIVFSVVVGVIFAIFIFLVNTYASSNVDIPEEINEYVLYQRFLRNPSCFIYEDIAGRSYPLHIDMVKFNQNRIERCYTSFGNKDFIAFKLKLSYDGKEQSIKTDNWDDALGPDKRETIKGIIVHIGKNTFGGEMAIEMQNI